MYIQIDNFDRDELRPYRERSEKQLLHWNEPGLGIFVAESPNVIVRALDAGYEIESFLVREGEEEIAMDDSVQIDANRRITDTPVYVASETLMKSMVGYELTSGVLAVMRRKELPALADFLHYKRIVVLEEVVNPTNLGAIVRSAAALGMDAVLMTGGCVDPLYRRAARVSMGTVFQIPWTFFPKGLDWMSLLHDNGFKTVAMALRNNSIDLDDRRLSDELKLAILMGTESTGLKAETIDRSDYVVKIPMSHGVDSLNVAAASAVAFWQLGIRKN